jgi:hypothetical protein
MATSGSNTYSAFEPAFVPNQFQQTNGQIFFTGLGQVKDYYVSAAYDAVRVQFTTTATPDALSYIGNTRNIESYWTDTTSSYKSRLSTPFNIWSLATTELNLSNRLSNFGLNVAASGGSGNTIPYEILSWRNFVSGNSLILTGTTPPDPYKQWWSAFWIFVSGGNNLFTPNFQSYSGSTYGNFITSSGGTGYWTIGDGQVLGMSCSQPAGFAQSYWNSLRGLVKKWKNGIEICPDIIWIGNGNIVGSGTVGTPRICGGNNTYLRVPLTPAVIF